MSSHADRVRFWTELLSEQKVSGLSVPDFCRDRGVSIHSYRGWRARLNKESSSSGDWVTLKTQQSSKSSAITLHIGAVSLDVVPGFDPQLLRDVVDVLQPTC